MGLTAIGVELKTDRGLVNHYLENLLCAEAINTNGPVQDAMRYAVLGSAQRIRPVLALRVARVFRTPQLLALRAAAAVELLHCASLVIDDLPCMDDASQRRNQPSAHIRYGEATAVLAAFGLVALSARSLIEGDLADHHRSSLLGFQLKLLRSLDCAGLIAGQAMDLQLADRRELRARSEVTELKTAPLFQLAVAAGAIGANLQSDEKTRLDVFGREFGLAFQMTDDLLDGDEVNHSLLDDKLKLLRSITFKLHADQHELDELLDYLHGRVADPSDS